MLGQVYTRIKQRTSQIFLGSQPEAEAPEWPVQAEDDNNTGTHSALSLNSSQYWPADIDEEDYSSIPETAMRVKPVEEDHGPDTPCMKQKSLSQDEFDLVNTDGESDEDSHALGAAELLRTPTRHHFTATGTQLEKQEGDAYTSPVLTTILSRHDSPQALKVRPDDPLSSPSRRPTSRGMKPSANTSIASTITVVSAITSSTAKSPKKSYMVSKLKTVFPPFKRVSPQRVEKVFQQPSVRPSTKRGRESSDSLKVDNRSKRHRGSTSTAAPAPSNSASASPSHSHISLQPPRSLTTDSKTHSKSSEPSKVLRKCVGDRSWPLQAAFGFNEELEVAGHPDFNDLPVGWGVKWELQRYEQDHQWKLRPAVLAQLAGPQAEVIPKLVRLVRKGYAGTDADSPTVSNPFTERENSICNPCKEMDREDAAWAAGNDEGLGLLRPDGWFGGKVRYAAVLDFTNSMYTIKLEAPVMGSSTHFTRAFGSKSLINLRVAPAAKRQKNIKDVLKSRIMVFGRGYRTLDVAEDKVLLVDDGVRRPGHDVSNEDLNGRDTLHYMMGYLNPLKYNRDQSLVKWRARFHLYFSTSIPGYRVARDGIRMIDDKEFPYAGLKCPSEKIATDGCGRVRIAVVKAIQGQAHWDRPTSAFQTRIFGAKGLLLSLMPDEELARASAYPRLSDSHVEIFLRPSQVKIHMDPQYQHDLAKLTIDVIRPAKLTMPSRLSAEAIQILSWNGVPTSVFEALQMQSFEERFGPLVRWDDGPMLTTAKCVEVVGRILAARRLRLAGGAARARGLTERDPGEDDEGEEDAERESDERSTPWWPDYFSGCPSSLEETIFVLLLAGFRPESLPFLYSKLKKFIECSLSRAANNFKIDVAKSLSALIVPDPLEILQPGEISITRSEPHIDEVTNQNVYVLEGPCVVLRNPAKQETDVRKVMMVNCPALHRYKDVIIMPVTDMDRTLASRLSGGDYDGDRVQVIWQEEIVSPFQNAATDKALEMPSDVASAFESMNSTVSDFLARSLDADTRKQQEMLQDVLLCPLGVKAGEYSIYHGLAARAYGVGSPEAIRLGHLFTESLDGAKNGRTVKTDVLAKDRRKYEKYGRCEWDRKDEKDVGQDAKPELPRKIEGPFVLDVLKANGDAQRKKMLAAYDAHTKGDWNTPWKVHAREEIQGWIDQCSDIEKSANSRNEELPDYVKNSIDQLVGDFKGEIGWRDADPSMPWRERILQALKNIATAHQAGRLAQNPPCMELQYLSDLLTIREGVMKVAAVHWPRVDAMTTLKITDRQDRLRDLSVEFRKAVPKESLQVLGLFGTDDDVSVLKASCAYSLPSIKRKAQFPFDVAMRILCDIKLKANGPYQTFSQTFAEAIQLNRKYVEEFDTTE